MVGNFLRSISVIAIEDQSRDFLANSIERSLPSDFKIEINKIATDTLKEENQSISRESLVITAGPITFELARKAFPSNNVILVKRNLTPTNKLLELDGIPLHTKVAVVNRSYDPAIETLNSLKRMIERPLELIPYWEGSQVCLNDVDIAVSPGMMHLCPNGIRNKIDIGMRDIALTTYIQMFIALNVKIDVIDTFIDTYFRAQVEAARIMPGDDNSILRCHEILSALGDSTFVLDRYGRVRSASQASEKLLGLSSMEMRGRKISDFLNTIPSRPLSPDLKETCRSSNFHFGGRQFRAAYVNLNDEGESLLALQESSDISRNPIEKMPVYKAKWSFDRIVGSSPEIRRLKERAAVMSRNDATILIYGETGTGKELFAQAIHNESERRSKPFMAFSFASLSESLIESELFGYEEGAFTGALKGGKKGLFEAAQGGTVFLDEIGDAPAHIQNRLLRVLQEKEIIRVGSTRTVTIDAKIIAATNRDLLEMVKTGGFRADLYYRLRVLTIEIPPLREIRSSIPELLEYAMHKFGIEKKKFMPDAYNTLLRYRWPGNVRELVNTIEGLVYMSQGDTIRVEELPEEILDDVDGLQEGFGPESGQRELGGVETDRIIEKARGACSLDEFVFILGTLADVHDKNPKTGRRTLVEAARKSGLEVAENKMRMILAVLHDLKLINIGHTKQGTTITAMGRQILSHICRELH